MNKEIYIKLDKSGFVIGSYVNKLLASHSVISDSDKTIIKVILNHDNVLTKQEAIETILEYNNKKNKIVKRT